MQFHRCAIRMDDDTVVATDIQIALDDTNRDDWYGTITLTHVVGLTAGKKYRLILDDGRSGPFLVRRNTSAGDVGRAVAIHGMGPLA
jgi:2-oxoglutarate dehydrogenase complex dehydrogenase (E1) component-like enzyme